MNSLQLRYVLIKTVDVKIGVCAKDQLFNFNNDKAFAVICNNENSYENGMHWVCFYKENSPKSVLEFFDSFGMPLEFYGKEFRQFATVHGKYVMQSSYQIQSNSSNLCGIYCLYFLINRNRGKTYNNILQQFSETNRQFNDKFVSNFKSLNLFFPKCSKCGTDCNGKCSNRLSSVCILHSKHCVRISQTLTSENE